MGRASTGSGPNGRALLSAFGQPVTLQDSSEITAIVRQRRSIVYNGTEAIERTHTVLSVPRVLIGTFAQGQALETGGERFYAAALVGW